MEGATLYQSVPSAPIYHHTARISLRGLQQGGEAVCSGFSPSSESSDRSRASVIYRSDSSAVVATSSAGAAICKKGLGESKHVSLHLAKSRL